MCKHMDVDVEGKEQNCLSCELCKQIDLRIKAESELKAIRDRIEAVTYETIKQKIYDNAYKGVDDNNDAIWCFDDFDFKSFEKTIYDLIKQIGCVN